MSIAQYCIDTGPYVAPGTEQAGYQLSGGYNCTYGTSGVRYLDVDNNKSEQQLWNNWWKEQIGQYGMQVSYYINGYNLSAHDYLYGEQPLVRYSVPFPIVMAIQLSNDNIVLSKFGLEGQADLTAIIPIDTFYATVTAISGVLSASNYEPKSGDLIQLTEYGTTRPGGRNGRVFEITERVDEMGGENNQLMGHYVWMIKAKRFDYNFELDAPRENLNDQVFDNKADGLVNTLPKIIETKEYTQFVDKSSQEIFDYSQHAPSNTSVYGDYDDTSTLVNLIRTPASTTVLGISPSTYIYVDSPSNYTGTTSSQVYSQNTTTLNTLGGLLSAYTPGLSSLVPLMPARESTTQNEVITFVTATSLLTANAATLSAVTLLPLPW